MGMFGALSNQGLGIAPMSDWQMQRPAILDAPTRKPSFFGQGGTGRGILGVIGDALAASNGFAPVFTQGKIREGERSRELEEEQRKRQQALEDAIALTQAKAQFREPTALEQNYGFLNKIRPGLGDSYATNFSNPMQTIDAAQPDGSVVRQFIRPPLPSQQQAPQAPNVPLGSPLAGAPNSKVIQGPKGPMQVWQINGEWYDNPEGR